MKYDELYKTFKEEIPEGSSFFEVKEKENLIDETDGIHIVFGMVIVPYILNIVQNNKMLEINKVFLFLENMAICEDIKIKEVLDFTVLEQLVDEGQDILVIKKEVFSKERIKSQPFTCFKLTGDNKETDLEWMRGAGFSGTV